MKLSLASLRIHPRPSPIWTDTSFLAEFGDPFVEQTGYEQGTIYAALRVFNLAYSLMLQQQSEYLVSELGLEADDLALVRAAGKPMEDAVRLFRKFQVLIFKLVFYHSCISSILQ
jgi:hypothetical protein